MLNAYQLRHSDFSDRVDIVCPKCAGRALVKGGKVTEGETHAAIRCVCTHCGYNQRYMDKEADIRISNSEGQERRYPLRLWGGEVDPFFHHPLWYMAPCLEGSIWAYNRSHLELIEHFVGANDRGRNGLPYKNNSIASRLPKWMSAAKNRAAVLKCIRDLKMKCILLLMSVLFLASCGSETTERLDSAGIDPFAEAARVELLAYNDRMDWWPAVGEGERPLLQAGELSIPADSILSRVPLDSLTRAKWHHALYEGDLCDDGLISYCYQPRHMLLFYRADNRILGYIELCFSCDNGEVSDGLRQVSFCAERMELLKALADSP